MGTVAIVKATIDRFQLVMDDSSQNLNHGLTSFFSLPDFKSFQRQSDGQRGRD